MAFVDWLLETESRDRESVKDIVTREGGSMNSEVVCFSVKNLKTILNYLQLKKAHADGSPHEHTEK